MSRVPPAAAKDSQESSSVLGARGVAARGTSVAQSVNRIVQQFLRHLFFVLIRH